MLYKIVRMYQWRPNGETKRSHTVRGMTGLYLEEAQAHCEDPQTSSKTCTNATGRRRTRMFGPWFDGYEVDHKNSR